MLCFAGWARGPGGDRLFRALRHSIIGAGAFHGRVREGIGWKSPAMATRSSGPPVGMGGVEVGAYFVDDFTWMIAVHVCARAFAMALCERYGRLGPVS